MVPTTEQEALEQAHGHLVSLRHLLGLLQAWDERDELASLVTKTRSELALLQETLEESIATRGGRLLMRAAADQESQQGDADEYPFSLDELYEQDRARQPLALDRDLRVIKQAWDYAAFPEQLGARASDVGLTTSFGYRTVDVLMKHFDQIRLDD